MIKILQGNVHSQLNKIKDESIDCVVTSPPYWGLRDYGVDGQLGLEPTYQEHIINLVNIFKIIKKKLKKSGTVWINYGDSYAAQVNGRSAAKVKSLGKDDRKFCDKPFSTIQGVLKSKDLTMMPNRIAIALQEDGWWVRSEIIWHKPNPMPESAKDRPTQSHEKIFLLSKSIKYYYDYQSIKEPCTESSKKRVKNGWYGNSKRDWSGKEKNNFNKYFGSVKTQKNIESGKNKRNVWTVSTKSCKEAHFATFPKDLIEPCIKAGCPENGIVLDPFGGSGTTGIVAKALGRKSILIELKPEYVEIMKTRINKELGIFA